MKKKVNPDELRKAIKAPERLATPSMHQGPTILVSSAEDALAKYKQNIEGLGVAAPPFHFFLREVAEQIVLSRFNNPPLQYDQRLDFIRKISGEVEWKYRELTRNQNLTNEQKFADIVKKLPELLEMEPGEYENAKEAASKFSDLRRYVKEVSEILVHSYGYNLNDPIGQNMQRELEGRINKYYDRYLESRNKGGGIAPTNEEENFIHQIISEREALILEEAKKEISQNKAPAPTKRIGLPITIDEYIKTFQAAEATSEFKVYVDNVVDVFWPPERNNPQKDALRQSFRDSIIQRQRVLKTGKARNYLNDDAALTADAESSLRAQFPNAKADFIQNSIAQEKEYLRDMQKLTDAIILAREDDPSVLAAIGSTLFDEGQKQLIAAKEQEIVRLAAEHIFDKNPSSTLEEFAKAIAERIIIDDPKQKDHIQHFEGYIKSAIETEFNKCINAKADLVIAEAESKAANATLDNATAIEAGAKDLTPHHARSAKELGLAEFLLEAIKILAKAAAIKVTSMVGFTAIGTVASTKVKGKKMRQAAQIGTKLAQIGMEAAAMYDVNKQLSDLFMRFMDDTPQETQAKSSRAKTPPSPSPSPAAEKAESLKKAAIEAAKTLQEASKAKGLSQKAMQAKGFVDVVERSRKARGGQDQPKR